MPKHKITIAVEVESSEDPQSLAEFYRNLLLDYEGTEHKTTAAIIHVDGMPRAVHGHTK